MDKLVPRKGFYLCKILASKGEKKLNLKYEKYGHSLQSYVSRLGLPMEFISLHGENKRKEKEKKKNLYHVDYKVRKM